MKERPILFSEPMVRALLAGQKMQTRRVVKPQPYTRKEAPPDVYGDRYNKSERWAWWLGFDGRMVRPETFACPFGEPGDRLWVRETHRVSGWDEADETRVWVQYRADAAPFAPVERRLLVDDYEDWLARQCRDLEAQGAHEVDDPEHGRVLRLPDGTVQRWKPAIFMPRWASRILLEITDVRIERLHRIEDFDAIAEGAHAVKNDERSKYPYNPSNAPRWSMLRPHPIEIDPEKGYEHCLGNPRMAFANLWNAINGRDAWEANPFVWVVSFRRIEP
jgi:hypothetical protein